MSFQEAVTYAVIGNAAQDFAKGFTGTVEQMKAALKAQTDEIERLRAENRQLTVQVGRLKSELAGTRLSLAGCMAQGKAMKGELLKIAPQSKLFTVVGGTYADGTKRIALDVVYEAAFDHKASVLGLPGRGSDFREVAK